MTNVLSAHFTLAAGARGLEETCIKPLALSDTWDFAAVADLRSAVAATHLTFAGKQRLLGQVVSAIRALLDGGLILVTAQMPSGGRMPPALLDADVLLLAELEGESRRLVQSGRDHVCIEERLVRHWWETGDNSLRISWWSANPLDRRRFEAMAEDLCAMGFERASI